MNPRHQLDLHLRARYPLLWLPTAEEERAEEDLRAVAAALQPAWTVWAWDCADGFGGEEAHRRLPLPALEFIAAQPVDEPALFILRDFHPFLRDPQVTRALRNLAHELRGRRQTIILLGAVLDVPPTLTDEVTVLDYPLPSAEVVGAHFDQLLGAFVEHLEPGTREALLQACMGMSLVRIGQVLRLALAADGTLDERAIDRVLAEKEQAIRRTEVLEFLDPSEGLESIGGLDGLKAWLERRALAFTERARRYGLPAPRGLLLAGIQGTGKSLSAKATANLLRVPLLRLDVGRLMGSLVGESEGRAREMIRVAEAMAPAVLWIDEIDKAFRGVSSGYTGDSGTSARVFGTILTWLQEKTSSVFVVATANNIEQLPPELLRKGRFDEIFFIDLPTAAEREAILEVHLTRRRPHRLREFDLPALAAASEGYSGAELEQAVIDAMYAGYEAQREFTTADIARALAETVPLSVSRQQEIDALRAWVAAGNARRATV
ncbi:MAG TPA: AAA family ATPase [Armatimonadetes bacterium]|nr:AAA family ATPase [Armatimonadota bacterium]